jgi:hypothetical protein
VEDALGAGFTGTVHSSCSESSIGAMGCNFRHNHMASMIPTRTAHSHAIPVGHIGYRGAARPAPRLAMMVMPQMLSFDFLPHFPQRYGDHLEYVTKRRGLAALLQYGHLLISSSSER